MPITYCIVYATLLILLTRASLVELEGSAVEELLLLDIDASDPPRCLAARSSRRCLFDVAAFSNRFAPEVSAAVTVPNNLRQ